DNVMALFAVAEIKHVARADLNAFVPQMPVISSAMSIVTGDPGVPLPMIISPSVLTLAYNPVSIPPTVIRLLASPEMRQESSAVNAGSLAQIADTTPCGKTL